MTRGRRPNLDLEPSRQLQSQRAFRERKALHLKTLEEKVSSQDRTIKALRRRLGEDIKDEEGDGDDDGGGGGDGDDDAEQEEPEEEMMQGGDAKRLKLEACSQCQGVISREKRMIVEMEIRLRDLQSVIASMQAVMSGFSHDGPLVSLPIHTGGPALSPPAMSSTSKAGQLLNGSNGASHVRPASIHSARSSYSSGRMPATPAMSPTYETAAENAGNTIRVQSAGPSRLAFPPGPYGQYPPPLATPSIYSSFPPSYPVRTPPVSSPPAIWSAPEHRKTLSSSSSSGVPGPHRYGTAPYPSESTLPLEAKTFPPPRLHPEQRPGPPSIPLAERQRSASQKPDIVPPPSQTSTSENGGCCGSGSNSNTATVVKGCGPSRAQTKPTKEEAPSAAFSMPDEAKCCLGLFECDAQGAIII